MLVKFMHGDNLDDKIFPFWEEPFLPKVGDYLNWGLTQHSYKVVQVEWKFEAGAWQVIIYLSVGK